MMVDFYFALSEAMSLEVMMAVLWFPRAFQMESACIYRKALLDRIQQGNFT